MYHSRDKPVKNNFPVPRRDTKNTKGVKLFETEKEKKIIQ